ncbi:hypothetical protein B7463_g9747, partial [Scytalidium lignicola]
MSAVDDVCAVEEGKANALLSDSSALASASALPAAEPLQELDWVGPQDPDNPLNCVAIDDVSRHFGLSQVVATIPLTLYVLGQALGPSVAAPVSETYGRKAVFTLTTPISLAFTLGAGFSRNIATLCILRFFAGTFGSTSLSVGNGTITDVILPAHRSVVNGAFNLAPFLGTALGPMVGGFAVQKMGWRWSMWLILLLSSPAWVGSLFMSETYKKIILQKREKKRGIPIHPKDGGNSIATIGKFLKMTILRPVYMLAMEPIVLCFSIYVAFNFSILFSFFDAFPIVFGGVYGFNTGETGLAFIGVAIGVCVAFFIKQLIDRLTYQRLLRERLSKEQLPPETRLYSAMFGSFLIPLGLFWFGWSSKPEIHWICPIIATGCFACGNFLVFTSCMLYLIDTYGRALGASATGANGILSKPNIIVTAVLGSSKAAAETAIVTHSLPVSVRAYGSPEELSKDESVDLVVVGVPARYIPRSSFLSREIVEAAHAKGLRTAVDIQGRFAKLVQRVAEVVQSGRIGSILSTSVVGGVPTGGAGPEKVGLKYNLDKDSGATILDVHLGQFLECLTQVLGPLKCVNSLVRTMRPTTDLVDAKSGEILEKGVEKSAPDQIVVQGELTSGGIVSVHMHGGPSTGSARWFILGEKGEIDISAPVLIPWISTPFPWKVVIKDKDGVAEEIIKEDEPG